MSKEKKEIKEIIEEVVSKYSTYDEQSRSLYIWYGSGLESMIDELVSKLKDNK